MSNNIYTTTVHFCIVGILLQWLMQYTNVISAIYMLQLS